jgi:hypothetical protein
LQHLQAVTKMQYSWILCGNSVKFIVLTYTFSAYMALAPKPTAAGFTSKSKEIIAKWEYSNLPKLGTYEGQI